MLLLLFVDVCVLNIKALMIKKELFAAEQK